MVLQLQLPTIVTDITNTYTHHDHSQGYIWRENPLQDPSTLDHPRDQLNQAHHHGLDPTRDRDLFFLGVFLADYESSVPHHIWCTCRLWSLSLVSLVAHDRQSEGDTPHPQWSLVAIRDEYPLPQYPRLGREQKQHVGISIQIRFTLHPIFCSGGRLPGSLCAKSRQSLCPHQCSLSL